MLPWRHPGPVGTVGTRFTGSPRFVLLLTTRCRCCSQLEGTGLETNSQSDQLPVKNQKPGVGSAVCLTGPPRGFCCSSLRTTDIGHLAGPAALQVLPLYRWSVTDCDPVGIPMPLPNLGGTYIFRDLTFSCKIKVIAPTRQGRYDSVTLL